MRLDYRIIDKGKNTINLNCILKNSYSQVSESAK